MVMVIMPGTYEPPERTNLRARLRGVLKDIANTQQHVLPRDMITTEHMVLDIDSQFRPKFFDPDVANLLHVPDDNYDRFNNIQFHNYDSLDDDGRRPMDCAQLIDDYLSLYISTHRLTYNWSQVGVGKFPFVGLHRFTSPEFRTADLVEVKGGDHPHLKAVIFNDLNGTNGQILLGEAMVALRLMNAQLRRARYIKHMMAPVLLFSFMGPQHARLVEAFFDGNSFVMRLTKLYDLRTKDGAALKLFAQWYLGRPSKAATTVPNRCDSEYCME